MPADSAAMLLSPQFDNDRRSVGDDLREAEPISDESKRMDTIAFAPSSLALATMRSIA